MTWKVGTKINFLIYGYLSSPSSHFLHLDCEGVVWWLSRSPSLEKVRHGSWAALPLRYAHALALAFKQNSLDRGQEEVSLEKPVWFCVLRKQCALYWENKVLLPTHLRGKSHACSMGRWAPAAHSQSEQRTREIPRADRSGECWQKGWYCSEWVSSAPKG